jgi:hypothetical protein
MRLQPPRSAIGAGVLGFLEGLFASRTNPLQLFAVKC